MRSAAVAVLPVITVDGSEERFTLLTVQPRVATGFSRFSEIPAGMMDASNSFVGVAAKEMKEETGLTMNVHEMVDLTHFAYRGTFSGVYPSAGGCNEYLRLFAWETHLSTGQYSDVQEKLKLDHGENQEGEFIRIRLIPLSDLYKEAPDSKSLSALALYNIYIRHRAEHYRLMVEQDEKESRIIH